MNEAPNLQIKKKKEYVWVTLPKHINMQNDVQIENQIVSELTGKSDRLVLDLINNDNIYSITIGLIMHLRAQIIESGGSICVVNTSKKCLAKLQQMQLNRVLKIYENEEELSKDSWPFSAVPYILVTCVMMFGYFIPPSE